MPLIEDIKNHLLNPKFPLTSILREALVLAGKLQSRELADWINAELSGYKRRDQVPEYRTYHAQSLCNGISGIYQIQKLPLPTHVLPKNMRELLEEGVIAGGVRELESLLESDQYTFTEWWPQTAIQYYNSLPGIHITVFEAYKVLPRGMVEHALDTVRTRLLQFVIEIEELNPGAGEIPSLEKVPPQAVHKIFEKIIMNEFYSDNAQKIEGVQGSNLATGQARISSSHASYTTVADAGAALQALKGHINDVAEGQRREVLAAIDLLVTALENGKVPRSSVVAAAETIANGSAQMRQALIDLSVGLASSLAASGVFEGIRYAIGGS